MTRKIVSKRQVILCGLGLSLTSAALLLAASAHRSRAGGGPAITAETSIDQLLGGRGRAKLAARLAQAEYGGRTFSWKQYASWGEELVLRGQVANPPTGAGPSRLLASDYKCIHCHNLQREDAKLTVADPDARAALVRKSNPADPARRDGKTLGLTTGTTFWGMVNREKFYNGYYARYHQLRVSGGRKMDPTSLADAVQVCCRYCSGGRFAEDWELDSIQAYLWGLELRLRDLDLPPEHEKRAAAAFRSGDADVIAAWRQWLRKRFPLTADATQAELPVRTAGNRTTYADGATVSGDAKNGRFLYQTACAGCHGTSIHRKAGAELVANDRTYHRLVYHGTERDGTYMPFFPTQRLSRQQTADIRAHLLSLQKE